VDQGMRTYVTYREYGRELITGSCDVENRRRVSESFVTPVGQH
jgi:hypothetical protein